MRRRSGAAAQSGGATRIALRSMRATRLRLLRQMARYWRRQDGGDEMTFAGMNYWAVLMAAVAAWMLGALWYSLLAKPWMAAAGVANASMQQNMGSPRAFLPFVIAFLAALVMAWVLAGIMGHLGQLTIKNGVISGAFCWLRFNNPP